MFKAILSLPRKSKQAIIIVFDSFAVIFVLFLAFSIRLGYMFYPVSNDKLLILIFAAPLFALPIFFSFGFYQDIIRFLSFKTLWKIAQGVSIYSILWGLMTFMAAVGPIPRSVIIINWVLVILVIGSSRLFARWILLESSYNNNVLIYGAGSAGRQLSNALNQSNEYNPIAFIDDAKDIYHKTINGLRVYSPQELQYLIDSKKIKEILIALPSISRNRRLEIINMLEHYQVIVRSLPGVSELAQGKVKVNDLLEIDLKDLLGRDAVIPNKDLFKQNIFNKVVMITGSGGSIGSELCRQVILLKPKKIVLFELSETALYHIEQELNELNEINIEISPVIGSVLDKKRAKLICKLYQVETIYHAAAYKHVPLVEFNPSQGVMNNTVGTLFLAEAAIECNVETFVLISTDKAVRPTNVMGASKRAAELVLQALADQKHNTCFTMVRFGNVMDSSGSVIPLFRKQIKEGGPLTVTHSDVVRYFMTIPEAVELVIQAGAMAKGGEVFVLDMGEPVRIYDLAQKMIKLSGLELKDEKNPKGDIEIQYTGLRPGEKLFEELLVGESFSLTENKLIMRAEEDKLSWNELSPLIEEITLERNLRDYKKLERLLKKIVPGFNKL
jgi:FlaA1/EpsC-like NDP-sugar epimerase